MTDYPKPIITADIILLQPIQNKSIFEYLVLLIKRGKDPFKDAWALPGGHFDVNSDPSILFAAQRELKEETNLENILSFFDYYDAPNRDPRGRYVDFVYYAFTKEMQPIAGDDASEVKFFNLIDLIGNVNPEIKLAFDHRQILTDFYHKNLRTTDERFAYELAKDGHSNQFRRNGEPYINHPFRVARNAVRNPNNSNLKHTTLAILGYIHDLGEDCNVSKNEIKNLFGDEIAQAFELLTHEKEVSYEDYINKIKENKYAAAIKTADLLDNFPGAGKKKETYQKAFKILTGQDLN